MTTLIAERISQLDVEDASSRVNRLRVWIGDDAKAITTAILDELGISETAQLVLFPWVVDRVHHTLRAIAVRESQERTQRDARREKRARAGGNVTVTSQSAKRDSRLSFLDHRVIMAGAQGGFKLYRNLTVAEHEARKLALEKNARPLLRSASGHAWAAEQCQKHKVLCLNDIDPVVLIEALPENGVRP